MRKTKHRAISVLMGVLLFVFGLIVGVRVAPAEDPGFPNTVRSVIHDDGGIGVTQFSIAANIDAAEPTQEPWTTCRSSTRCLQQRKEIV